MVTLESSKQMLGYWARHFGKYSKRPQDEVGARTASVLARTRLDLALAFFGRSESRGITLIPRPKAVL